MYKLLVGYMEQQVPLINVKGLKTYFYMWDGVVRAVDGVDMLKIYAKTSLRLTGISEMNTL